ncbi:hypothetical protein [Nocardioides sp. Root151]|uniref:hypothetical protein n=1 Tax=Nocardioides sp. Root151 TaxID=1736475 RepID=UPI0007028D0F|nr:hypothetical protein [Nocardioides sp. Root151]KQZ70444.1 hypothetical protein ASD66_12590 [Nocardioides sp. Root151]
MPLNVAVVAEALADSRPERRVLVAIDGVDGSGKTTFAQSLADQLRVLARSVLVIHVDDFLHTSSVRHRQGRNSPEGYFHDSYDYGSLTRHVLEPLGPGGDGWFRAGVVDRARDVVVPHPRQYAGHGTIVLVEGLFLLRDELFGRWDHSIFLDVETEISLARKGKRDGLELDSADPLTRRYVEGQRLYLDSCRPRQRATWVIDNGGSGDATRTT